MPTFSGRVEARLTVPTGGAAVSASNPTGGPTTCTVPAGNYYLTSAGGVSSLLTEFATQLTTSRPPASGSWTATLSTTTGLVTLACTEPASISWTSTALRDVLGFEYNMDYPDTAAKLAAAVGYGTWSAAWLCNESSGSLAASFGSTTLTAVSTPTYSNAGPRGGDDKAVGFDSVSDAFSGGDVYDALLTDFAILLVAKVSSSSNVDFAGKGWSTSGFALTQESGGLKMYWTDGTHSNFSNAASLPTNQWCVLIGMMDRTANVMRCGWQSLTTGTQTLGSATSASNITSLNSAGNFTLGAAGAYNSTAANVQIAYAAVAQGSSVASFSSSLGTALSNFATYMSSQTGTQQAKGLWFPDCPINLEGDPERAPLVSDARQSMSPTGQTVTLVGNTFYRHRAIVWSDVPIAQVWDAEATYENGSWEEFFSETQLGLDSSWFSPGSPIQIYWSNAGTDALLGADATIAGWSIVGLNSIEPQKSRPPWTGLWRIEIPTLVAVGS